MHTTDRNLFILFFLLIIIGIALESISIKLYSRFTKKKNESNTFLWSKYLFLLLFPLLTVLIITYLTSLNVLKVFFIFSIAGPILEWLIGFSYYTVVGHRLWSYHKYDITYYTSWLTIPLWGLGGVIFYFLAKIIIFP